MIDIHTLLIIYYCDEHLRKRFLGPIPGLIIVKNYVQTRMTFHYLFCDIS